MKFSEIKKHFIPSIKACHRPTAFTHKWLKFYSFGLLLSQLLLGVAFYSSPNMVTEDAQIMAKNIINLTNEQRNKNELSGLKENGLLNKAASAKLSDMFRNNYWEHFSPVDNKKPWDFIMENGYEYVFAGENLAKGYLDSGSAVNAWMASPTHKDNILSKNYNEIGVAVGTGTINGKPTTLVVQMFGSPALSKIAISETLEEQTKVNVEKAPEEAKALVLGTKEENINFSPMNATMMSRIPYFIIWFIIFGLIVFDGAMLRRCGLHTSRKHLFEFRSALLINVMVFIVLCANFVAIS